MSQFDYSELADRTRDNEIISCISKIHEYILGISLECYRDFENRVYIVHGAGAKSTSYDIVKETYDKLGPNLMGPNGLMSNKIIDGITK